MLIKAHNDEQQEDEEEEAADSGPDILYAARSSAVVPPTGCWLAVGETDTSSRPSVTVLNEALYNVDHTCEFEAAERLRAKRLQTAGLYGLALLVSLWSCGRHQRCPSHPRA